MTNISANIEVGGNVEGSIVVGNNNVVETHNYHGTVIKQEALSTQRRNLSPQPPPEPEGFVGRKRELKQVEDWIAQDKVVIVQGVDGIGKTSLIKEVANSQVAKSQPDGVVFVDALDEEGNLLEFGDLTQRIFDALFESQPHQKVDLTSARTHLSNTHPLVLLNSISLTPQSLSQLQNLFSKAPILIATENPLLMRGRPTSLALGPLDREDSLALLASLTSLEDQAILDQIAGMLENVPAALSIVADTIRMNILSLDEVLERLQSYNPKEANKTKAAVERAFQLLYSTLTEEEHGMLDQVAAAFGVSVDRKWLENEYGGAAVSDKLESLGLLHANSPRLRLMPGLKPLLLQGRDLTGQRERLLSYLLAELKTRWNDFGFIKDELGNLLGLLAWSAAKGQWSNVAALGRAIDPYLTLSGHWDAWRKTLEEVRRAADGLKDLALQGWVLHQLATHEFGMGNLAAAQKLLKEAISIRQKLGDQTGLAYSQHNLQVIAPVAAPAARPGNLTSWVLGGVTLVAIAAFLIFNNARKSVAPSTAEPVTAASEVNVVLSASETPMPISTATEEPSPSPSLTPTTTFTPSSTATETPTASPTYAIQSKIVVNELAPAACFYGPSNVYLNKGTRRIQGNEVDLSGRIETDKGIWVLSKFSLPRTDASDPCWMDAKYLTITEEQLMSVPPIDPANPDEYKLPIDYESTTRLKDPVVKNVTRTGDTVTIGWDFFDVGAGQYPNHDENFYRYLIEAWLCKAGKIVFTPSGWGPYGPDVIDGVTVSAKLQDETGCTEPSHARLYLAWAHGYAGPTEITPWPRNEIVLPSSTP